MNRFLRLITASLIALPATALRAQDFPAADAGFRGHAADYEPSNVFTAADLRANPKFPLRIKLVASTPFPNESAWGYSGTGKLVLHTPAASLYAYQYKCNAVFDAAHAVTFQARWLDTGKRLQILVFDPETRKRGSCRLTTTAEAIPHR